MGGRRIREKVNEIEKTPSAKTAAESPFRKGREIHLL
jgi:hypothetical protein